MLCKFSKIMSVRALVETSVFVFLFTVYGDAVAKTDTKPLRIGVLSQFKQQESSDFMSAVRREIDAAFRQSGKTVELVHVAEFPLSRQSDNEKVCRSRFDFLVVIAEYALFQLLQFGPCVPTAFIAFTAMAQQERDVFFLPYRDWLTGFDTFIDLHEKRLDLMRTAYPQVKRVGVIFDKTDPSRTRLGKRLGAWGKTRGLNVVEIDVDLVGPSKPKICCKLDAIYVPLSGSNANEAEKIMGVVRKLRIPSIVEADDFLPLGATMSYQVDRSDGMRRLAQQVHMLSGGIPPRNIPIEGVSTVLMTVNVTASRLLQMKIDKGTLLSANRIL